MTDPAPAGGTLLRSFVELLLGGSVPADSGEMTVIFERPLPSWAWFLVFVFAIAVAVWSYRRLAGATQKRSRSLRTALVAFRVATLVLLVALISGPTVRFERTRTERDRLVVLVDRSRSLSIADAPGGTTRDEQLAAILRSSQGTLGAIARDKDIDVVGFSGGTFSLAAKDLDVAAALGKPEGERTDLDAALRQSITRGAGRPLSGVLVLSDGRSSVPVSPETMRLLERDSVPVFTVALGSRERIGDAAINATTSPARAFVRDRVPVEVRVDRGGIAGKLAVKLVDVATGRELARKDVAETAPTNG